ncbi:MAG: hypothetical protein U1E61_02380 [Bradyrhizobium sp.]
MFRDSDLGGFTSQGAAGEGALRHPDGSIDFGAYRERARRARNAAIVSSIRGLLSLVANVFAGKPEPAARHHAT